MMKFPLLMPSFWAVITSSITHWCPNCHSSNIAGNGHTRHGNQRCLCHDCGKTRVLIAKRSKVLHGFLEKALRERLSLRGITRIFGVSVQTLLLLRQLAEALPAFPGALCATDALVFEDGPVSPSSDEVLHLALQARLLHQHLLIITRLRRRALRVRL